MVLSLQESCAERIWIVTESPSLLSKHSKIENMDVPKTQTSFSLRFRQFLPSKPMNLMLTLLLVPPVSAHHGANLVTQLLCEVKANPWQMWESLGKLPLSKFPSQPMTRIFPSILEFSSIPCLRNGQCAQATPGTSHFLFPW